MGMVVPSGASPPPPASIFNPGDKSSLITLSNADQDATRAAGSGRWVSVRSVTSKFAGKWYFEVTDMVDSTTAGGTDIGIANALQPMDNGGQCYPGMDLFSVGYVSVGNVYRNATNIATLAAYTAGAVISVAFEPGVGVWFRVNGGVWNTAGNPATGAGGYATPGNALFASVGLFDNPAQVRLNTGQFAFSYALPAGFAALG